MRKLQDNQAGRALVWLLLVVVAVATFVGWRWLMHAPREAPAEPVQSLAVDSSPPAAEAPKHPVEAIVLGEPEPQALTGPEEPPLPADPRQALLTLAGSSGLANLLAAEDLIPRIVATVDGLPSRKLSAKVFPLASPSGVFAVEPGEAGTVRATANAERYAPYLALVETADLPSLVRWYVANYPAFQAAWRQLGHATGEFNDRAVEVLDHLLETPVPAVAPAILREEGHWIWADPRLEARSAGQRVLLRLRPQERAILDQRLAALRQILVGDGPVPPAD